MTPVLALLTSRILHALIGAVALGLLASYLGLLAGLENDAVLLALGLLPLGAWAGWVVWLRWRRSRTEQALADGMTAGHDDARATDEEREALRARFDKALALLRKVHGGKLDRRRLYELPWYVIIGPPGSGKTTALANSGLHFPLADELGRKPVRGIGGTALCDWWFTDDAVLIDTAGRYTTHDSHETVDRAGWHGFLDLLKKHRPRQPVNGALVAISITDLTRRDPAERQAHAAAVRARLRELTERFGVRFPIYVLFTKLDLVAGFLEFFGDMPREEREQVLGMTFPLDDGTGDAGVAAGFPGEFDLLVERLNQRLIERVHGTHDGDLRGLVYGFPAQFASLKDPVAEFLEAVFQPSRLEARPLLRGVYFTSGTQEGTPIDRLMGTIASAFGLRHLPLRAFSGPGRSYFLHRLLRGVVFEEAGVVGTDQAVETRQVRLRRMAQAALVLLTLGAGGAWVASYLDNQRLVHAFDDAVGAYREKAQGVPGRIADGDLRAVLPVLNAARTLPAGYEARRAGVARAMDLGLSQQEKLATAGDGLYRGALAALLRPRLIVRLHGRLIDQLRRPAPDLEEVERLLALYLGLAGQGNGPVDAVKAREWLAADLAADGYAEMDVRAAADHADTLLEQPSPRPSPVLETSKPLVDQARAALREVSPAARGYAHIRRSAEAARLAPWRITDHAGAEAATVFRRISNAKLTDGLPGLYTYAGFQTAVLPHLPAAARAVRESAWVVGAAPAAEETGLQTEILTLYLRDYARRWDALLGDVGLVDVAELRRLTEVVALLSGRTSPLRLLLKSVAEETVLARLPQAPAAVEAATGVSVAAKVPAGVAQAALSAPPYVLAAQLVDEHFRPLNDLGRGTPARLDDLTAMLAAVHRDLVRLVNARNPGQGMLDAAATGSEALARLSGETAGLPFPVKGWMDQVVHRQSAITVGGARAQINAEWQTNVLPWCRRTVDSRYPFTRTAASDAALDDFVRLFAPGGLIDAFFQNRLKPYVDVGGEVWRWQRVDGVDLGIAPSVLTQFQQAARIRDAFFSDGGREPRVRIDLKATALDVGSEQVRLTVDGQPLVFPRNSPQAQSLQWPGNAGARQVIVAFSPGEQAPITRDGPWAFLRLLDAAGLRRGRQAEQFAFAVGDGVHHAGFEMRVGSAHNPFSLPDLKEFRCPTQL